MAGKISSPDFGPIANAQAWIKGSFWAAFSDSSGNYHIKDVLPGQYRARGNFVRYHTTEVYNIRIAPDTTSIVDFPLVPGALPVSIEDMPILWIEKYIKQ